MEIVLGYPQLTKEFIRFINEMNKDEFVGDRAWFKLTREQKEIELSNKLIRRETEQLPAMMIFDNEVLIGLSWPLRLDQEYNASWYNVLPDAGYWKIGPIFLLPQYRGKGIAKKAGLHFLSKRPKIAYCSRDYNKGSISLAKALGLKFSHYFFVVRTLNKNYISWLPSCEHTTVVYHVFKSE